MAEEKKLTVFPVGITEKEIKKIADQAIEDSGAANEVPLATIADAGKVIKVGDDGKYELAEAGGGGSGGDAPYYVLTKLIGYGGEDLATVQDIVDLIGTIELGKVYTIYLANAGSGIFECGFASFSAYGPNIASATYELTQYKSINGTRLLKCATTNDPTSVIYMMSGSTYNLLPSTSALEGEKTYALKYTGGEITWVEEA